MAATTDPQDTRCSCGWPARRTSHLSMGFRLSNGGHGPASRPHWPATTGGVDGCNDLAPLWTYGQLPILAPTRPL